MKAQDSLLTRQSDSVAEREEISLTAIPVTFAVARSGFEELGKMVLEVMKDTGRNSREIRDILATVDWMLRGMLKSLFAVTQRLAKATGGRGKQARRLEGLVEEEWDRTFRTLAEMVLVQLVRLIFPWMERMFGASEQTRDVPVGLIGILEGALDAVDQSGFEGGAAGVRERVALEVCHELKGLPRRIPVDGGSRSVEERRRMLAKKEAVWYLGAVLQRAAGAALPASLVDAARRAGLGRVEREFVLGRAAVAG